MNKNPKFADMMRAYLNLGSNMGDSRANIARAVDLLRPFATGPVETSDEIVSDPWGYDSDRRFVNVGVALDTHLEPLDLLHRLQEIERNVGSGPHRNPDGSYRDREIDIDIIAIDEMEIDSTELTVPHRLMDRRPFVLQPMTQLAPSWRHPRLGLTAAEMLEALQLD